MKKFLILSIISLFAFAACVTPAPEEGTTPEETDTPEQTEETTETEETENSESEETVSAEEEPEPEVKEENQEPEADVSEVTDAKPAQFLEYSESAALAAAADGTAVIFFHASWCSTCKALENEINRDISTLPAGITILKADFDDEVELKKKYGVNFQHTLVQIDANGNEVKKWIGGGLALIRQELNI